MMYGWALYAKAVMMKLVLFVAQGILVTVMLCKCVTLLVDYLSISLDTGAVAHGYKSMIYPHTHMDYNFSLFKLCVV